MVAAYLVFPDLGLNYPILISLIDCEITNCVVGTIYCTVN